ncbi:MAG: glycosyltransferase family 2 protein [Patescibacteria group bacterium]
MIDLSIIIVSYNTKDFIRECLKSIRVTSKGFDYEIIVVDNVSSDGTSQMVKEEFPDVIAIKSRKNLGFSKANNAGVEKSKGRYVLFLNPDTVVYKDSLFGMVKFMDEHKEAGAATCKLVMPGGRLDDAAHRGFPNPWNSLSYFSGLSKLFPSSKLFGGYNLGWMDLSKPHEIDACAGAFMMVRRQAGEKIGWWDEDYFFYGEDLEFCFRLKEIGWKIYFVPSVSVLHYKGVSGGIKKVSKEITTANLETKKRSTNWRFNAMKIFYRKHYQNRYPLPLTWFVMGGINLKHWLTLRSIK